MYITLFEMDENVSIGRKIIKNFYEDSVVPVVEGKDRYGLTISRVKGIFECEGKLVVELDSEIYMVDGSFEAIAYSIGKNEALRHIGIVRCRGDFTFEGDESPDAYTSYVIEAAGVTVQQGHTFINSSASSLLAKIDKGQKKK